jgi:hypothetical protein
VRGSRAAHAKVEAPDSRDTHREPWDLAQLYSVNSGLKAA